MGGIFNLIYNIVSELAERTIWLISNVFNDYTMENDLFSIGFDFKILSDTPIFSMPVHDLLLLFFTIFYSMFFIMLLYKATKKFINVVFGVFRV